MNNIYPYAITRLRHLGESLSKKALFIDKPWTLIDDEQEVQRLIFKSDKSLIISKNGNVVMGKWDYLPEAKSLLIDRGTDTILCNEGFVDPAAMILKKDGTDNQFFVLANANVLPDLDVQNYLYKIAAERLFLKKVKITDGRTLEIHRNYKGAVIEVGNKVSQDLQNVKNGRYPLEKNDIALDIEENSIISILFYKNYATKGGPLITIEQNYQYSYQIGDKVFIEKDLAPDNKYRIKGGPNILVEDGIIMKKAWL